MVEKNRDFPVLENELKRLERLYEYDILDLEQDDQFDDLTQLTAAILDVPICQITLMDADWQVFISNVGVDMKGNQRSNSFCQYAVVQTKVMEVQDTIKDERFENHPLVQGDPHLRFYVGAPIVDKDGYVLGTLCGYDTQPKELTPAQTQMLEQIARTVMRLINYRKMAFDHEKYARIFKLNQDLLCVIDRKGYFKLVNPAFTELLGWTQEELLSQPITDFIHAEDIEKVQKEWSTLKRNHPRIGFDCRLLTKAGKSLGIDWIYFADDTSSVIVASGHNITDLLNTRSALQTAVKTAKHAVQVKDEFLSNISHEIRTPLSSIVGFTDLLQKSALDEEQKKHVGVVDMASKHLLNIVNDLLDTYKLQEGNISLENVPTDLNNTLDRVVELYQHAALSKGISLSLHKDRMPNDLLYADETRLFQVFSNLISNAIKFTEEGSVTITVTPTQVSKETIEINFSIRDTGIGISDGDKIKIFERFKQATTNNDKAYGGTGLGLSISKLLLELHGSELQFNSELHQGSHFFFDITFDTAQESIQDTINDEQQEKGRLKDINVLLAEDNTHLQLLARAYVEKNGGKITLVSDGEKALDALDKTSFDVIIMDLQMPNMDGYMTAKKIRQALHNPLPIIGCSAHGSSTEISKCYAAGMNDFISKPYTEEGLVHKIRESLKKDEYIRTDDFHEILEKLKQTEGEALTNDFIKILGNRIHDDLADVRTALSNRSVESIYQKAHFLSTTFATMRFHQGDQITEKICRAHAEKNDKELFDWTSKLVPYLEELAHFITTQLPIIK